MDFDAWRRSLEGKNDLLDREFTRGLIIIYVVGAAGRLIPAARAAMDALTPWTLLLGAAMTLLAVVRPRNYRLLVWTLTTATVTFLLEAIGVRTGFPFGAYAYGTVLGFHILDVPPVIGLNWALVVLGAAYAARTATDSKIGRVLLVGALAATFDFVMEPAAVALDFWTWAAVVPPAQNYVAWFAVAAVAAVPLEYGEIEIPSALPMRLALLQVGYFAILDAALYFGAL
jgi:bisanhydrobacterioruberin hydratase